MLAIPCPDSPNHGPELVKFLVSGLCSASLLELSSGGDGDASLDSAPLDDGAFSVGASQQPATGTNGFANVHVG